MNPLDAVAAQLTDAITAKLDRPIAERIVREQADTWACVTAIAATGVPIYFYVIEITDQDQHDDFMVVGSRLDPDEIGNLQQLANDIHRRTGVTPRHFICIDMQQLLVGCADVMPWMSAEAERYAAMPGYADRVEAVRQGGASLTIDQIGKQLEVPSWLAALVLVTGTLAMNESRDFVDNGGRLN
jgi:hypothetical protein